MKGEEVAKIAEKHGLQTRQGRGSHVIIRAPSGSIMVVYHGELSKGVFFKVKKWLATLGIILTVLIAVAIRMSR